MTRVLFRSLAAIAGGLLTTIAACQTHPVPGFGPILTPEQPLEPEPIACGAYKDENRKSAVDDAIVGAADFHNHQFSNIGFGGRIVWGSSFSRRGIEDALSTCGSDDLCADEKEIALCVDVICPFTPDPTKCREECESRACPTLRPHGHFGDTDPVGAVLGQGYGHMVDGYPHFVGWPNYNSYTHQQAYHRWLRRAFDGGLKLMVMMAVSNETLCKFLGNEHPCDDMTNVDLQLAAAADLEAYIDYQDDCRLNGSGWYRIAKSPQQAREIIASGAMAVVLGIEVDTLFGCHEPLPGQQGYCTETSVRKAIDDYKKKGVRHLFPVHVMDNGFGGAAAYNDFFNFGNLAVNRKLMNVRDCSPDYAFRFGNISSEMANLLSNIAERFGIQYEGYPQKGPHCNAKPLTPLGEATINALIDKKMIIDVDHMSALVRQKVLDIAEVRHYGGLVSGHTGFTDLCLGDRKNEGQLTRAETQRLVKLGGLLAPGLHQGKMGETLPFRDPSGRVRIPNDCGSSAKSFAQVYLYAVEAAGGRGVGFGSDMNGLAGLPAPRFGLYACGGDVGAEQKSQVMYPFQLYPKLYPAAPTSMNASVIGHRLYDINVDGYAHAGMFPDFVAELQAIGLTPDELKPLFSSAEAYISMWECAEDPNGAACLRSRGSH